MLREKLRVFSHLPPQALGRVDERVPEVHWIHVHPDGPVPEDRHADVLLTFAWGGANLPQLVERGVRWIHTIGTGVDRFPLEAARGRLLTCARGASAVPIAEWVIAMILAHAKRLPDAWVSEPPERWNLAELDTLEGRALGLIGIGSIGVQVAQRALAFGMDVRALRRTSRWSPVPRVEIVESLGELLEWADHLVLAAPATSATRRLIGARALSRCKPGLHLVNVARGSLLDQDALRDALDTERVARASLDVCIPEPLPSGHWLYEHPRVQLSPHVSWAAPDSFERLLDSFSENALRWLRGDPLEGVVDVESGY